MLPLELFHQGHHLFAIRDAHGAQQKQQPLEGWYVKIAVDGGGDEPLATSKHGGCPPGRIARSIRLHPLEDLILQVRLEGEEEPRGDVLVPGASL